MSKLRQRRLPPGKPYQQCLTATELLDAEADSLTRMTTLKWPRPLVRWREIIGEAARQAKNQGLLNTHVWFEAKDPRAKANDPAHIIELGAQIALEGHPLVTYFFAIGRQHGETRQGLRKLHFDLECSSGNSEPKPKSHMQVAGRFSNVLAKVGYDATAFDHLLPDLDKPRIPCLPQSFALLIHVALLEYHTSDSSLETFVRSTQWLKIVTTAESRVLKPYFDYGHHWLTSTLAENSLIGGSYTSFEA